MNAQLYACPLCEFRSTDSEDIDDHVTEAHPDDIVDDYDWVERAEARERRI